MSALPRRLGDFTLLEEIGRGGMGVVYLAEQQGLGRKVAVKVLRAGFAQDDAALERFRREIRVQASLSHPNLVRVFAVGEVDSVPYFAMELVAGLPLDRLLSERRAAPGDPDRCRAAALLLSRVAFAVHHAHRAEIIHRDLKPSNILVAEDATPFVTDFGLARPADAAAITQSGDLVGTVTYMAPEQVRGRKGEVDARSDVYSLGATLYECLALRPPFDGDSASEVIARILHDDPQDPCKIDPSVPRDLATIALKALEKEPARRYASADELAADLRLYLDGMPIRASRAGPVRRIVRQARKHPARVVTVAALLLLACVSAILVIDRARTARRELEARAIGLCEQGRDLALNGDFRAAVERYRQALALDPDNVESLLHRGFAAIAAQEPTRALADFERASALEPGRPAARFGRALALTRLGREADPNDAALGQESRLDRAEECILIGDYYYFAKRPVSAARFYRRAIEIDPHEDEAYLMLAFSDSFSKDYEASLEHADLFVKLNPSRALGYFARAMTLLSLGDAQGARAALDEAEKRNPSREYIAWYRSVLHETLLRRADSEKDSARAEREAAMMEKHAEHALTLNPNFPFALYARAAVRARSGNRAEAVESLERMLRLGPGDALVRFLAALLWIRLGEPKKAEAEIQTSLALSNELSPPLLFWAEYQKRSSDLDGAAKTLERALEVAPLDDAALEMLASIEADRGRKEAAASLVERLVPLLEKRRSFDPASYDSRLTAARSLRASL